MGNVIPRGEWFGRAIDHCGSPIEAQWLAALVFFRESTFDPWSATGQVIGRDGKGVLLHQQHRVDGCYLDFAFTHPLSDVRFAVELDGFAYHGSTPDQFADDCERQRHITSKGWTFLRFSGKEIVSDPRRCAREAVTATRRLCPLPERPHAKVVVPAPTDLVAIARAADDAGDFEGGLLAAQEAATRARARLGDGSSR